MVHMVMLPPCHSSNATSSLKVYVAAAAAVAAAAEAELHPYLGSPLQPVCVCGGEIASLCQQGCAIAVIMPLQVMADDHLLKAKFMANQLSSRLLAQRCACQVLCPPT